MSTREKIEARGPFDVELTPRASDEPDSIPGIGRRTLSKKFHGDLQGTSEGQMLTAMTDIPGSAGYVAIERFNGTLHGRRGSFALQHRGVMNRGAPDLTVTVVPDSGRDELKGLTGSMDIIITDGSHSYAFHYALPPSSGPSWDPARVSTQRSRRST